MMPKILGMLNNNIIIIILIMAASVTEIWGGCGAGMEEHVTKCIA